MSDKPTLLPPNATPLERALEQALARIEDVPVPVDTLWDPWRCPAELLPWLAWACSVDEWDPDWPEHVKRRVIAAAPDVHRLKGTCAAVERALRAIGVFAEIVAWWQASPRGTPGTFSVTAWVNEQLHTGGAVLTDRVQRQIDAIVRCAKPVSRAYDLLVGVLFRQPLGTAAVARGLDADRETINAGLEPVGMPLGTAALARGLEADCTLAAGRMPATTASAGAAAVLRGIEVDRRTLITEVH